MAGRSSPSPHGSLFGSDSFFEVLALLTKQETGTTFHGADLADQLNRSRNQVQRELAKLRSLDVIAPAGTKGRAEQLEILDSDLAQKLLALPNLIEDVLGRYNAAPEGSVLAKRTRPATRSPRCGRRLDARADAGESRDR
jgi:hypothetical protein